MAITIITEEDSDSFFKLSAPGCTRLVQSFVALKNNKIIVISIIIIILIVIIITIIIVIVIITGVTSISSMTKMVKC